MWLEVTRTWTDHNGARQHSNVLLNADQVRWIGKRDGGGAVVHWSSTGHTPMNLTESYEYLVRRLSGEPTDEPPTEPA